MEVRANHLYFQCRVYRPNLKMMIESRFSLCVNNAKEHHNHHLSWLHFYFSSTPLLEKCLVPSSLRGTKVRNLQLTNHVFGIMAPVPPTQSRVIVHFHTFIHVLSCVALRNRHKCTFTPTRDVGATEDAGILPRYSHLILTV